MPTEPCAIIPGHPKKEGRKGWQSFERLDINLLSNIQTGKFNLGNFGANYNDIYDKFTPYYAIPSPWASAYFFDKVLIHGENYPELRDKLFLIVLNMLYDIHVTGKLKILSIDESDPTQHFNNFWNLAPDFLKVDKPEKLYFFENQNGEILGGISRRTLVWASQKYKWSENSIAKLQDAPSFNVLVDFICELKSLNMPDKLPSQEDLATFWNLFTDLGVQNISLPDKDKTKKYEDIFKPKEGIVVESIEKFKYNDKYIFDTEADEVLKSDPEFLKIIHEKKQGEQLPLNRGGIEWTLFSELLTDKIVLLDRIQTPPPQNVQTFYEQLLFPIKKEYFKYFNNKYTLKSATCEDKPFYKEKRFVGIRYKQSTESHQIFTSRITPQIVHDARSIAIWPPFKSKYLANYVIEYLLHDLNNLPLLEFYSIEGARIKNEIIFQDKEYRLYKIQDHFPSYINLKPDDKNDSFLGILKKDISQNNNIVVAIDFGSSHTIVTYQSDNDANPKVMEFNQAAPIIIADDQSLAGALYRFFPCYIHPKPPTTKNEYDKTTCWSPFRTLWAPNEGILDKGFLKNGFIPLTHKPVDLYYWFQQNIYKSNLKWDSQVSQEREGFLVHLINLIVAECEALNVKKITIRWSYPGSFSEDETRAIGGVFEKIQRDQFQDANIVVEHEGYIESDCAKQYFLQVNNDFQTIDLNATIDIGGGSSDIAVFRKNKVEFINSIKYGGGDISGLLDEVFNFIQNLPESKKAINRPDNVKDSVKDFDGLIRCYPGILPDWDGYIHDFFVTKPIRLFETLLIFYGSLFYYLGLLLKKNKVTKPIRKVALGGNGVQFLKIVAQGQNEIPSYFQEIFKKLLVFGQGLEESTIDYIKFYLTSQPKMEVSLGMLYLKENKKEDYQGQGSPILGLNISKKGKTIQWYEQSSINSSDIASDYDIDLSIAQDFIDKAYKLIAASRNDILHNIISSQDRNMDLNHFSDPLIRLMQLRAKQPIATPLLLSVIKLWLKEINGNPDNGA